MTHYEEIILEQYFRSQNLDKEGRDFYLNLFLNSKELTDSIFNFTKSSPSQYDLVFLSLNNEGSIVKFDGSVTNGEENKLIYGFITRRGNKYIIHADFYRLHELIFGHDKEYSMVESFTFGDDDKVTRRTTYGDKRHFKSEIQLKTDEDMEEYYKGKVGLVKELR